jgi:SAM-dependent methyltransferase
VGILKPSHGCGQEKQFLISVVGGGFDCFLAARQIGATGRVIGVDMTPEMVSKARTNVVKTGLSHVDIRLAISDVIADAPIPESTQKDLALHAGSGADHQDCRSRSIYRIKAPFGSPNRRACRRQAGCQHGLLSSANPLHRKLFLPCCSRTEGKTV